MCLFAIIHPSSNFILPFGPISSMGALPFKSPESLIGGFSPSLNASVFDISTCV